jgi:hypothetical protein
LTLFIGGDQLYVRAAEGQFFNLDQPTQPLLMVGEELAVRPLKARERKRRVAKAVRLKPDST